MNKENYINREESKIIKNRITTYFQNDLDKRIQGVVGLAGVGKSVMLQALVDDLSNEEAYKNKFFCRVDISDCADEIEIYFRIASQLKLYYTRKHGKNGTPKALEQFMTIHRWVYGSNINNTKTNLSSAVPQIDSTVIGDCVEKINNKINASQINDNRLEKISDKLGIFIEVAEPVMDIIPFVQFGKVLVEWALSSHQKYKLKKLLEESLESISNKVERECVLRELLIEAIHTDAEASKNKKDSESVADLGKENHPVIILDNFQLNSSGELGRDHTWLIKRDGLINCINAYWIIAGRFAGIKDIIQNEYGAETEEFIQLQGFDDRQAREYIEKRAGNYFIERKTEDEIKDEVVEKMLSVCGIKGHNFDENVELDDDKIYYPPYLLDLVVNHLCKLCMDPGYDITPNSFVGLNTQEEFIGYYFYKDLSDLMTNAFQILSCLVTWDDKWVEIVRERFDNHLLNAETVLFKLAPMEHIGGKRFKLHEGMREGLFNVSTNYIKYDVLKYLYEKFIEIYENKELDDNIDFWYEPERLEIFADCVYQYTKLMGNKDYIVSIQEAIKNIYDANSSRGIVTESFIRFYSRYIDQYGSIFKIPFITLENQDFSDENMSNLKELVNRKIQEVTEDDIPNIDNMVYFMENCFKLTDMYTNINCSSIACNIEELGIVFWEKIAELVGKERKGNAFWRSKQQLVKQMNACAFDNSQEHNFSKAHGICKQGLDLAYSMIKDILTSPDSDEAFSKSEIETLKIFVAPEKSFELNINSYQEINQDIYEKLKKAYRLLITWKNECENIKKILADMLLVEYFKLRGNYPWYNFRVAEPDLDGDMCVKFGILTYWMRRALFEVYEEEKVSNDKIKANIRSAKNNMINSYHNVCVYLYKSSRTMEACLLEHEVIEEAEIALPKKIINEKIQYRINDIGNSPNINKDFELTAESRENLSHNFCEYLWKSIIGKSDNIELFKKNERVIECMQYMGDYYLHLGFYSFAYQKLRQVILYRCIWFGLEDNKTLDSLLRLYVLVVVNNETECQRQIEMVMMKDLINNPDRKTWYNIKKGLAVKVDCMEQMIQIVKEGGDGLGNKLLTELEKLDKRN